MSKITPCLWFATEAEEAANYYVSVIPNSHVDHVQKNTADTPGGKAGTVLIVEFTLNGQRFTALNGGERFPFSYAVSFQIDVEDQAEFDHYWNELAKGGKHEPCGWVKDRYGLSWQIVPKVLTRLIADPDKAKSARVLEAMLKMTRIDIAALRAAYEGKAAA